MKRIAVSMILGLALAACASAPVPEQPKEAEWVPCSGHGFYEASSSYARCIKHIAILAEAGASGTDAAPLRRTPDAYLSSHDPGVRGAPRLETSHP